MGALIRGRGMWGTFQSFQLMYHALTMFIELMGVCVKHFDIEHTSEQTEQTIEVCGHKGTCTYHRVIYMLTLHARINVPLSSAHTWTLFHHPQFDQASEESLLNCFNYQPTSSPSTNFSLPGI